MMLGKYYLEGLWVGYYVVDGKAEYYYELFEQTLDGLTIVGKAFDEKRITLENGPLFTLTLIYPNQNLHTITK